MGAYITAEDLAKHWKVDVATVYRWGRDGVIPREVIGRGTVRFPDHLLQQPAPDPGRPGWAATSSRDREE